MNTYTVLVDMDGVLGDLLTAWINSLNKLHNADVKVSDINTWHFEHHFPNLTYEQIHAPLFDDNFWDDVKPIEEAVIYLKKIIDYGHKVYICTNTHYRTAGPKFDKVLFKYFPYLNYKQLITCTDKQMIKGDYLVDDHPENLIGGDYKGILYSQPHNMYFQVKNYPYIQRFASWKNIYEFLCPQIV